MRTGRSGSAVVLAGALALGAFTAPSAEAADTGVTVSNLVLNKGKPIVVGTSAVVTPDFSYHVSWPSGIKLMDVDASPFLYHDTTVAKGANEGGIYTGSVECFEDGTHAADCDGELYIEPRYRLDSNNDATTWKIAVSVHVFGTDGHLKSHEYLTGFGSVQVKRAGKATVDASPEPVAKGKALTVTGRLTRADWVRHAYTGFGGKSAKLQFRKAGSSSYSTVKIVKADSAGRLKTTVTASADGYWRWTFGETATTGGATSAGDYVDVK
ncbi:hypothetical protein [Streptomyces olivochromogenes]|uniref:hypothetical protein n=1 Tax=Streptomyces olivochromogenes TaxID=1963 RepID=UPI001F26D514|nr:hypothetical protein [Streptomyces olivochromogenes]MCF3130577.1 hypothetical protein [Streptomyces olivochromogenes]